MKRFFNSVLAATLCVYLLSMEAFAAKLIPVGEVIGLELRDGSVSVAAFDDKLGASAKAAGLQIGDRIVGIDGVAVGCAEDVRSALLRSDGQVELTVLRGQEKRELCINPQITNDGPRLGVSLRQGTTGLGTVTWYDPATGCFGALGHGVSNSHGQLVAMKEGRAYPATVLSVKRGACGEPGQLRGGVDGDTALGTLDKNTVQGVFGKARDGWNGEPVQTANADEIHHSFHGIRQSSSGIFCGNSQNLSQKQMRRTESAASGDGFRASENHRRHRAGNVRLSHYAKRQADRGSHPRSCE